MDMNAIPTEQLALLVGWKPLGRPLDTRECATLRGLKPNTLEIERSNGSGPPYMQDRKHGPVRYSERDVLLWMYASRRRHTAQPHRDLTAVVA